jgi:hypothetical protein
MNRLDDERERLLLAVEPDPERRDALRSILAAQDESVEAERRRERENRRFDALPLHTRATCFAIVRARAMRESGIDPEQIIGTLFDGLPEDASTAEVVRHARRVGLGRCAPGAAALAGTTFVALDGARDAGRRAAQRAIADANTFAQRVSALAGFDDVSEAPT